MQSRARRAVEEADAEQRALRAAVNKELAKKRSKLSKTELALRSAVAAHLSRSVDLLKQRGTAAASHDKGEERRCRAEYEALAGEAPTAAPPAAARDVHVEMTVVSSRPPARKEDQEALGEEHVQALAAIDGRAAQQDAQLDELGQVVDNLTDLAVTMRDEAKVQDGMLDGEGGLQQVLEHATDRLENVNVRLKALLKEVRASDKMCVDVICMLLLLGMIALAWQTFRAPDEEDDDDGNQQRF